MSGFGGLSAAGCCGGHSFDDGRDSGGGDGNGDSVDSGGNSVDDGDDGV